MLNRPSQAQQPGPRAAPGPCSTPWTRSRTPGSIVLAAEGRSFSTRRRRRAFAERRGRRAARLRGRARRPAQRGDPLDHEAIRVVPGRRGRARHGDRRLARPAARLRHRAAGAGRATIAPWYTTVGFFPGRRVGPPCCRGGSASARAAAVQLTNAVIDAPTAVGWGLATLNRALTYGRPSMRCGADRRLTAAGGRRARPSASSTGISTQVAARLDAERSGLRPADRHPRGPRGHGRLPGLSSASTSVTRTP